MKRALLALGFTLVASIIPAVRVLAQTIITPTDVCELRVRLNGVEMWVAQPLVYCQELKAPTGATAPAPDSDETTDDDQEDAGE